MVQLNPYLHNLKSDPQAENLIRSVRCVRPNLPPPDPTPDIAPNAAKTRRNPDDGDNENSLPVTPVYRDGTARNAAGVLITIKLCAVCSVEFPLMRPHGKFCSTRCRMRAYRARRRVTKG